MKQFSPSLKLSNQKQQLAVVGLLLGWCVALIGFRTHLGSDFLSLALVWNLFLATIPLPCSAAFRSSVNHKRPVFSLVFFVLWLLFFPNAPYILTDLIHLSPRPHVPLWFLMAMLLSCAGTGTLLGYFSLINIHNVVEKQWGKATGWAVVFSSLLLCGFGIYLGRFLRWNSWDAFTHPLRLAKDIVGRFVDAGPHPHPLSVTLIFGVGLLIGYLALRVMATSICFREN